MTPSPLPSFASLLRPCAAKLLAGDADLSQFRAAVCDLLLQSFAVSRASLWKFEGEGDDRHLLCVGLRTVADGYNPGGAQLRQAEFSGYFASLLTRGVLVADDVYADPSLVDLRAYFEATGVRSMLDTAFQINGRPFGVLCLEETSRQRTWTAAEAAALRQAASSISLVISRIRPASGPDDVPDPD